MTLLELGLHIDGSLPDPSDFVSAIGEMLGQDTGIFQSVRFGGVFQNLLAHPQGLGLKGKHGDEHHVGG